MLVRVSQALPTLYAAGAELPAIHSLLCQPSQRQKNWRVVISTVKKGISNKLLQKQIHFAGKITFILRLVCFIHINGDEMKYEKSSGDTRQNLEFKLLRNNTES